jgi:fumarate reductase subunit D
MRYSREPFFWSLFSAGGVITAFLAPVLIVLTGFVVPAEEIEFSHLDDVFGNVLVRLVVFALASLSFMHFANRFRHTLVDMGMSKSLFMPVSVISYIVALAGTVWAAVVVLS